MTLEFVEEGSAIQTWMSSITLDVDKNKLAQVMRNLLSNALKFTPPGGVVKVQVSKVQAGGSMKGSGKSAHYTGDTEHLRIQVVDSGAGIAPVDIGCTDYNNLF